MIRKALSLGILTGASMLLLASCAPVPTHFYTLVKPLPDSEPARASYAIEVLPVSIPSQVDQPQLVIRRSDGELALAELHLWVAPLADEMRSALSSELSARTGAIDVYRVPKNSRLDTYRIRTRVQRFESVLSGRAQLKALWTIEPPGRDAEAITCSSLLEQDAKGGYLALAEAHQQAISDLAEQMSLLLAALVSNENATASCPR